MTDEAAAILVAMHVYDKHRTREDGQEAMKELEEK